MIRQWEKESFICIVCAGNGRCLPTGTGSCWHQWGYHLYALLFQSGYYVVLYHRSSTWADRRYQDLWQVQQRWPRYVQDCCELVLRLYLPDCGHHSPFILPLSVLIREQAVHWVQGLKITVLVLFCWRSCFGLSCGAYPVYGRCQPAGMPVFRDGIRLTGRMADLPHECPLRWSCKNAGRETPYALFISPSQNIQNLN